MREELHTFKGAEREFTIVNFISKCPKKREVRGLSEVYSRWGENIGALSKAEELPLCCSKIQKVLSHRRTYISKDKIELEIKFSNGSLYINNYKNIKSILHNIFIVIVTIVVQGFFFRVSTRKKAKIQVINKIWQEKS